MIYRERTREREKFSKIIKIYENVFGQFVKVRVREVWIYIIFKIMA